MRQVCAAARGLRTIIITGHTGTYDGIDALLGVCTAYGFLPTRDLITPAGARPGDLILCTKPTGLEVLTNLSIRKRKLATRLFGTRRVRHLARLIRMQSCVREARVVAAGKAASAMHDVTEGGLVAALGEMANASNVGFVLNYKNLYLLPELKKLAEHFDLSRNQILSMSSTGSLLAAIPPGAERRILSMLSASGAHPQIIGAFTKDRRQIVRYDGQETSFPTEFDDPYAEIVGIDS
jgi:hydrogenase expression/formation protein HypE